MLFVFAGIALIGAPPPSIETNRTWDVLEAPSSDEERRTQLQTAEKNLGAVQMELGDTVVDGDILRNVASAHGDEPLLRVVREVLRRPVDLDDFLLFLDDVLVAQKNGFDGPIHMPPSRARNAGIFLHPYDIFRPERAKRYGETGDRLAIDPAETQDHLVPAQDGDLVGPRWAARYQQPDTSKARLAELAELNRNFARRVESLLSQLRAQGAYCEVEAAVRRRERGFLIYGSWWLSQAVDAPMVTRRIKTLNRLNRRWKLHVPITWRHPGPWSATVEGARQLAETYSVDYATRKGAKRSKHYDGRAVDFWAVDLPRSVTLKAPDGAKRTFDLSDPEEPRDLSLTPKMIDWVETHFRFRKLETDYPHWNDARKRR